MAMQNLRVILPFSAAFLLGLVENHFFRVQMYMSSSMYMYVHVHIRSLYVQYIQTSIGNSFAKHNLERNIMGRVYSLLF